MSRYPSAKRVAFRHRDAKITIPPRDFHRYFQMFEKHAKTLKGLASQLDKAKDNEDFEGWVNDSTEREMNLWSLSIHLGLIQEKLEYLAGMGESLDGFKDEPGGTKKVVGWAEDAAERTIEKAGLLEREAKKIKQYRSQLDKNLEYYDDLPKQQVEALYALEEVWPKIYKMVLEAPERIRASLNSAQAPETEDVETLYHASVDAKTLLRSGFKLKGKGGMGLGGSTDAKNGRSAISFTFDLYIAKEIARSLKEGVLIAQGKVKPSEVLEWADRAGIKEEVINFARSTHYGRAVWEDPRKRIEHAMSYWVAYLWLGKRYNPVFWDNPSVLVKKFKRVRYGDIGVLVADVNMSDPDILYVPAEREYRVPVSAIVDLKKVIQ